MLDYRLYLVTDDPSRYAGNWLDNVRAAVEGGVTCVQYRDTESDANGRLARLRALRDAIGPTPIVVNDFPELARAVGAQGVHVGQGDLPPAAVRAIVGARCEIGLSITARAQLDFLDPDCVDCLGIGPVFDARKTKADAAAAMGLEGLAEIVRLAPEFANCAIGGLDLANSAAVLGAGAKGLALVSAFSKSEDPYETARKFRLLLDDRGQ